MKIPRQRHAGGALLWRWSAKDMQAQRIRAPPRMRGTRGSRSIPAMKSTSSNTEITSDHLI